MIQSNLKHYIINLILFFFITSIIFSQNDVTKGDLFLLGKIDLKETLRSGLLPEAFIKFKQMQNDAKKEGVEIEILSGLEEKQNFDDFGIPGFKGERQEKIQKATQLLLGLGTSMQIDVEALYKHISGYYKKLKKRRSLESKFVSIFSIIKFYGLFFFIENYNIDDNNVYDFVLGCSENSQIIHYFNQDLHQQVIQELDTYIKIYNNESD